MSARVIWERGVLRIVGVDRAEGLGRFGDGLYLERRTVNALGELVWIVTYDGANYRDALAMLIGEHEAQGAELGEARAQIADLLAPVGAPVVAGEEPGEFPCDVCGSRGDVHAAEAHEAQPL